MNVYWKILIGLVILYYGYVLWVLKFKKNTKEKKDSKKFDILQINTNLANNSLNEQTDLEAILNQVDEVENNSKLLDAFKKGSLNEDDSNSLTRKKHEKLKVIRNEDTAEKNGPDSET